MNFFGVEDWEAFFIRLHLFGVVLIILNVKMAILERIPMIIQ